MKKLLLILTSVILLNSICVFSEPFLNSNVKNEIQDGIVLRINSTKAYAKNQFINIDSSDTSIAPYINNGRTMVPVRFISENFGCNVAWDEKTQLITISNSETIIKLNLGMREMYVNGNMVWLDSGPQLQYSRTFIPLRGITEAIGKQIYFQDNIIIIREKEINKGMSWVNILIYFATENLETIPIKQEPKPQDNTPSIISKYGRIDEFYQDNNVKYMRIDTGISSKRSTTEDSKDIYIVPLLEYPNLKVGQRITIFGNIGSNISYISKYGITFTFPSFNMESYTTTPPIGPRNP